jgi:hypothetical protein
VAPYSDTSFYCNQPSLHETNNIFLTLWDLQATHFMALGFYLYAKEGKTTLKSLNQTREVAVWHFAGSTTQSITSTQWAKWQTLRAGTRLCMTGQRLSCTVKKLVVNIRIECNWLKMGWGAGFMSVMMNLAWHQFCVLTRCTCIILPMTWLLFIAADTAAHSWRSACGEDALCALLPSALWHCQQVCTHVPHQPFLSCK